MKYMTDSQTELLKAAKTAFKWLASNVPTKDALFIQNTIKAAEKELENPQLAINNVVLRDHFAGQALLGMLSNEFVQKGILADRNNSKKRMEKNYGVIANPETEAIENQEWHATAAYQFADAMLKERIK